MIEELNNRAIKYSFKENSEINCVMYAFQLYKYREVWEKIEREGCYPDTEFIKFCILKGYLIEKEQKDSCDGDYIVYFSKGKEEHIGFIKNSKIKSKWGDGYIWGHNEFNVPYDCGNIKYYTAIDAGDILKYFKEFAIYIKQYKAIGDNLKKRLNQKSAEEKDCALIESGICNFRDSIEMYLCVRGIKNDILVAHWRSKINYLNDLKMEGVKEYFTIASESNGNYDSKSLIKKINEKYE